MNDYGNIGGLGVLAWVFTALLLVLVIVTMLAARGIIHSNHIVGIRIPSLQRSENAWEAGHGAAILPALVGFSGALICVVIGVFAPVAHWGVVLFFVGAAVWTFMAASRAAKTEIAGPSERNDVEIT